MNHALLPSHSPGCIPLIPVVESEFAAWLEQQDASLRRWLTATGFKAKPGSFSLAPGADGQLRAVVMSIGKANDLWALGSLPSALPEGDYVLDVTLEPRLLERLSWVGRWALTSSSATNNRNEPWRDWR
jgi:leucyl aminopeptidase